MDPKSKLLIYPAFILWMAAGAALVAQVPNSGFEWWTLEPQSSILYPDGWSFIAAAGIAIPVTKSSIAHAGTAAARGEVISPGVPGSQNLPPNLVSIPFGSKKTGFAVSQRHSKLNGYYRFSPVGGDKLQITVTMMKNRSGIGFGAFLTNAASTVYNPFQLDINYNPGSDVPDTCAITITVVGPVTIGDFHAGSFFLVDDLSLTDPVSVRETERLASAGPYAFWLAQNYPNPFNAVTVIPFSVNRPGYVRLRVVDLSGREAAVLVDRFCDAGRFEARFDASGLASGVYFCDFRLGATRAMRKLLLVR
jgi:hypothetical protein